MVDYVLTWVAGEGIKGPWRLRIAGRTVLFGFDDETVYAPMVTHEEIAIIREAFG